MCSCVCARIYCTVDWSDNIIILNNWKSAGATSLPTCAESKNALFVQVWVMWCVYTLRSLHTDGANTHCWHYSCEQHVSKAFFSSDEADWIWKHQCVHSTCHRAVEAVVSASWYWGGCGHAGGYNTAQCTLFQWFLVQSQRDRQTTHS